MMSIYRIVLAAVIAASPLIAAVPATKPAVKPSGKPKAVPRHQQIDHGPFVTATIGSQWEEQGITNKGIAVKLPATASDVPAIGGALFDTDTCRISAIWIDGFVDFTKDWTSVRDSKSVKLVGTQLIGSQVGPGWAKPGFDGKEAWRDPRHQGFGPLPKSWMAYRGVYRWNRQNVFSYTIGNVDVLDAVEYQRVGGRDMVVRRWELGACDHALQVLIADGDAATTLQDGVVTLRSKKATRSPVALLSVPKAFPGIKLVVDAPGRVVMDFPPSKARRYVELLIHTTDEARLDDAVASHRDLANTIPRLSRDDFLTQQIKGTAALWPETITTTGQLAQPRDKNAAYVVDTITLPDDNPWKSWMRPGGFDFFTSDPTKAAICNWSGDVWTVSGITGDLKELKWRRIASGLFQPLGLKIVKDQIYVIGRDQLTRLVDLNGDGETDFYECVNNDMEVTPNFHEFTFGLETDPDGNFVFAKAGPVRNGGRGFETIAAHHGAILKVSPDGKTLSRYATGFRAPTGFGVGPDGQVTAGDNEGSWVPKCRLAWVKPGGFYGVVPTAHLDTPPTDYDRPLCWFPKSVDNASGGQVWVTGGKWGPFENRLLHMSYGTCSLFLAMKQDLAGVPNAAVQGGVVRFPLSFDSGIMRARFNPADGQLYVAGLKGWQTSAGKDGCFQRVRFTGKPVHMPTSIEATKTGLKIGFTCKLSEEEANDTESYAIERWNYQWGDGYGSADYSVDDPAKSAHDTVKIKSAKLQPDGKTVVLEIPDMKPAMQYKTEVNLVSDDDADVRFEIYHSVHALP